jgi:hypothetical protein
MSIKLTAPSSTAPAISRRGAILFAGLLNAMRQVGGALGLAVLVTVATAASAPIDAMSRGVPGCQRVDRHGRRAGVGKRPADSGGVTDRRISRPK